VRIRVNPGTALWNGDWPGGPIHVPILIETLFAKSKR
jgi:hypothetical protein